MVELVTKIVTSPIRQIGYTSSQIKAKEILLPSYTSKYTELESNQ